MAGLNRQGTELIFQRISEQGVNVDRPESVYTWFRLRSEIEPYKTKHLYKACINLDGAFQAEPGAFR